MKYNVINKELMIADCRIADLTMEQVNSFLNQWEEGSSIGTLTLFYDRNNGYVVLNRDNKNYEDYKKFTELYLSASEEKRSRVPERLAKKMKKEIEVLENCIDYRKVGIEVDRALKNCAPGDVNCRVLNEICNRYQDKWFASVMAFLYGVMVGKREERARRKKAEA